jgi:ATP-dependent DNA ligase
VASVAFPSFLAPMQPELAKPFPRDGWVYEETYDGWRGGLRRNGID